MSEFRYEANWSDLHLLSINHRSIHIQAAIIWPCQSQQQIKIYGHSNISYWPEPKKDFINLLKLKLLAKYHTNELNEKGVGVQRIGPEVYSCFIYIKSLASLAINSLNSHTIKITYIINNISYKLHAFTGNIYAVKKKATVLCNFKSLTRSPASADTIG